MAKRSAADSGSGSSVGMLVAVAAIGIVGEESGPAVEAGRVTIGGTVEVGPSSRTYGVPPFCVSSRTYSLVPPQADSTMTNSMKTRQSRRVGRDIDRLGIGRLLSGRVT